MADTKKRHCSHDGSDKKCRKAITLEVRSKVMQFGEHRLSHSETSRSLGCLAGLRDTGKEAPQPLTLGLSLVWGVQDSGSPTGPF